MQTSTRNWARRYQVVRSCALLFVAASCSSGGPASGGGPPTDYVLDVRYLGTAPAGATRAAFDEAFSIIRETITAPLNSVSIPDNFDLEDCHATYAGHPKVAQETTYGVIVYVFVTPIDGANGVLGSAGPCLVRSAPQRYLTALGVMQFDEDDVAAMTQERLTLVVLHEMLHVLGFGTIWEDNLLIEGVDGLDARFLGPRARAACANTHAGGTPCATTVPVHSADGAGSAYAHWRESFFTNELMTPFLNAGAAPFSSMSVESLGDLGYAVSGARTEAYTVSGTELRAATDAEEPLIAFGPPLRPTYTIDDSGVLRPYRRDQ